LLYIFRLLRRDASLVFFQYKDSGKPVISPDDAFALDSIGFREAAHPPKRVKNAGV
jgi:hypothetical protein